MKCIAALVLCLLGMASPALAQEDGQVYRIKNRNSDKVLAPSEDGTLLVQQPLNQEDETQQWKLVKFENFFRIINVQSGKALRASRTAGEQIALVDDTDEAASRGRLWSFEKRRMRLTIQARLSGFYLGVLEASTDNGAQIVQNELEEGNRSDQLWELVPVN